MSWFSYNTSLAPENIDIGKCSERDPCKHRVKIRTVKTGRWSAINIYQLYKDNNLEVPDHFKKYGN